MSWKSKLLSTVALGVWVSAQPVPTASAANAATGAVRTSAPAAVGQPEVHSGLLPTALPREEPIELAACAPAAPRKSAAELEAERQALEAKKRAAARAASRERNARTIAKYEAQLAAQPAPTAIDRAKDLLDRVYGHLRSRLSSDKQLNYSPPPSNPGAGRRG